MDKSWMQLGRLRSEYTKGLQEFITFASNHVDSLNRIRCPCRKCTNRVFKHIDIVKEHLDFYGIDKAYTRWVNHGEDYEVLSDDDEDDNADCGEGDDGLEDLIEDLRQSTHVDHSMPELQHQEGVTTDDSEAYTNSSEGNLDKFDQLLREARKPLYPGCEKFSKLDFLVRLLHIKTINRWSNKSFNMNLELIKAALPEGETLPKSYYEAKAFMRNLELGYFSIHACINDCVLYYKELENFESSPFCHESRYKILEGKGKKVPRKVFRYFPLIPRLQRLFMSRMTAGDMRWHGEKRDREENVMRHPADSKAWEEFDKEHEWFSNDPRNIRLGLASDGFNPFGNMSNAYSMWPVLLMPYNLPPWKCMKEPFIFMSSLIPGPKSPGNDIDVYLRPLIDELIELWENGVDTYDPVTKEPFRLHAALLWTINDFPAFGNLSGWSTKGKLACPSCNKDTYSRYLRHCQKLCYMKHGYFLPHNHRLKNRSMQLFGENSSTNQRRPKELSGDDVLAQMEGINFQNFGKNTEEEETF